MKHYLRIFFWKPIAEHKFWVLLSVASLIMLSAAQWLFILLAGPFLKAVFASSNGAVRLMDMDIIHKHVQLPQFFESLEFSRGAVAIGLPVLIVVAGWLKALGSFFFQYSQEALACFVAANYRTNLFEMIVRQPLRQFRRRAVGEWMSQIMNDVMIIQSRFSDVTTSFIRDTCLALAALIAVLLINWRAGLIIIAICPFLSAVLGRASKRVAYFTEQFQLRLAATAGAFLNVRVRFGLIRAEQGEAFEFKRFDGILQSYYRMIRRSLFLRSTLGPGMELFGYLVFAGFIWFLAQRPSGDSQTLATEGVSLIIAVGALLRPLRSIGEQITKWQEIRGALKSGYQTYLEVSGTELAKKNDFQRSGTMVQSLPEHVQLTHLEVCYDKNLALKIGPIEMRRGKSYAVIGPSGAGKSTFVKVLAGLIDPEKFVGSVSLGELQGRVSFVSQEPFFFEGSLRDNLTYGAMQSTGIQHRNEQDAEVKDALSLVNMFREVLADGKEGLDRSYQGIGGNLSGGQLQRLVLAREILRHKDILVLDEPTSAVDPKTEKEISERLIEYCHREKKILIFITHRLQHLSLFDEIWFFENGQIEGSGNLSTVLENPRIRSFCGAASD